MALTPEQEWTLVGCGLIAHADEILDIGEWDEVLRYVGSTLSEADQQVWMEILSEPGSAGAALRRARAAARRGRGGAAAPLLADGAGGRHRHGHRGDACTTASLARSAMDLEQVARWREMWTRQAHARAELTVSLAAMFVNLDGHLDFHEAIHFDNLLERLPIPVGRRVELSELLHTPPTFDDLVERLIDARPGGAGPRAALAGAAAAREPARRSRARAVLRAVAAGARQSPGEVERLLDHDANNQ
jgi:hypothetical protein